MCRNKKKIDEFHAFTSGSSTHVCGAYTLFFWASDKNYCSVFWYCVIAMSRQEFILVFREKRKKKNNIHHTFHCWEALLASHKVIIHMRIFFSATSTEKVPLFASIVSHASEWNFAVVTKFNLAFSPFHIGKHTKSTFFSPPLVHTPSCSDMEWGGKNHNQTHTHKHTHEILNVKWKIANEDEAERQSILI